MHSLVKKMALEMLGQKRGDQVLHKCFSREELNVVQDNLLTFLCYFWEVSFNFFVSKPDKFCLILSKLTQAIIELSTYDHSLH